MLNAKLTKENNTPLDDWIINSKSDSFFKGCMSILNRCHVFQCSVNPMLIEPVDVKGQPFMLRDRAISGVRPHSHPAKKLIHPQNEKKLFFLNKG